MKIIAINAAHTKNAHEAAFEVDSPPDPEVLANVKYGTLQISFRDPYLYVASREHEPPISGVVVANINSKYASAERTAHGERTRAAAEHAANIADLKQLTGLPVR